MAVASLRPFYKEHFFQPYELPVEISDIPHCMKQCYQGYEDRILFIWNYIKFKII